MAYSKHTAEFKETALLEAGEGPIQVPDAALMFGAQFERSGPTDLKLTAPDGSEMLITGYFGSGTPQPLMAPNTAVLDGATVEVLAGPMFPGQYAQAGPGQTADSIGKVESLEGSVSVQHADGTSQQLAVGDLVFQSDVIETGKSALVGVKLADGTLLTLQESGKLILSEFVFNPNGTDNSALLNVLEGTFSLLAGEVAPTGDMKIQTPIATMGVRGTSIIGVDVSAAGGRLTLTQDPDGHVGFIQVFNNLNGDLYTVLRTIFSKITLSEGGMLVLSAKSPGEIAFDQNLTNLLHNFYSSTDGPEAGPDTQGQPLTGSPNFSPSTVQEINFGPPPPGPVETITLPAELIVQFIEFLFQDPNFRKIIIDDSDPQMPTLPDAGDVGIAPVDEDDIGTVEAMLEGGLPFTFGDTGPGTIGFASLDGQNVLDAGSNPVLSGGTPLVYHWDAATNTLTAFAGQDAIFGIEINPVTGEFKITLFGAVDHIDTDSLDIDLAFTVIAADGATAEGTLSVTIGDDAPTAVGDVAVADDGARDSVDMVVMLDISGSMSANPNVAGFNTRLALAQEAIRQLFANAVVNDVMIVAFAGAATAMTFQSAQAAIDYIGGLDTGGGTNYQAALDATMNSWTPGLSDADQTLVYFLSDGAPNSPISAEQQAAWEAFLAQNGVEEAFAVGIGDGLQNNENALDPIAWQPDNAGSDPIFVTNEGALIETLTGTLPGAQNVITGDGADDFGADGPGGVTSIVIDGVTYTYDGESINGPEGQGFPPGNFQFDLNTLAQFDGALPGGDGGLPYFAGDYGIPFFMTDGGTLHVMTQLGGHFAFQFADDGDLKAGDWQYEPAYDGEYGDYFEGGGYDEDGALPYENFQYTITDADGDTSTANLTIVLDSDEVGNVLQGTSESDTLEGDASVADVLVGSLGSDIFVLNSETIADFIADYDFSGGDQIDLSGLISFDPASDALSDFVRLEPDDSGLATDELQIDATGSGQNFTTVAVLNADAGISVIVNDAGEAATVGDVVA
jgi:hypothetical protein